MRQRRPGPQHRPQRTGPRRGLLLLLATVIVLAGAGLVATALAAQQEAPAAHDIGRIPDGHRHADRTPAAAGPTRRRTPHPAHPSQRPDRRSGPLGPSQPVHLTIPALDIDSPVNPIGLAADGTLAVPQPGPRLDQAAWFRNSPTPGQPGPSIIEGHVDSPQGPSVFFRLGDIAPGDLIEVTRRDGVVVTFAVAAVRDYAKSAFPTRTVYGGDLSRPSLHLITCSDFNTRTRHHEGNEVVFARLKTVHRP